MVRSRIYSPSCPLSFVCVSPCYSFTADWSVELLLASHAVTFGGPGALSATLDGALTLRALTLQDAGIYECNVDNGVGHAVATTHLSVTEPQVRAPWTIDPRPRPTGCWWLEWCGPVTSCTGSYPYQCTKRQGVRQAVMGTWSDMGFSKDLASMYPILHPIGPR